MFNILFFPDSVFLAIAPRALTNSIRNADSCKRTQLSL